MKDFFSDNLGEFQSALQLSIDSKIETVFKNPEVYSLSFQDKPRADERWAYFEKLSGGEWKEVNKVHLYQFPQGALKLEELTQFLFLSRLEKENMLKLASLDLRYKKYVIKIFGIVELVLNAGAFDNPEQIIGFLFSEIEKRKMTIRELAQRTGLSMVSISNFKAGKDIRLSNFLKILSVLEIKMKLE